MKKNKDLLTFVQFKRGVVEAYENNPSNRKSSQSKNNLRRLDTLNRQDNVSVLTLIPQRIVTSSTNNYNSYKVNSLIDSEAFVQGASNVIRGTQLPKHIEEVLDESDPNAVLFGNTNCAGLVEKVECDNFRSAIESICGSEYSVNDWGDEMVALERETGSEDECIKDNTKNVESTISQLRDEKVSHDMSKPPPAAGKYVISLDNLHYEDEIAYNEVYNDTNYDEAGAFLEELDDLRIEIIKNEEESLIYHPPLPPSEHFPGGLEMSPPMQPMTMPDAPPQGNEIEEKKDRPEETMRPPVEGDRPTGDDPTNNPQDMGEPQPPPVKPNDGMGMEGNQPPMNDDMMDMQPPPMNDGMMDMQSPPVNDGMMQMTPPPMEGMMPSGGPGGNMNPPHMESMGSMGTPPQGGQGGPGGPGGSGMGAQGPHLRFLQADEFTYVSYQQLIQKLFGSGKEATALLKFIESLFTNLFNSSPHSYYIYELIAYFETNARINTKFSYNFQCLLQDSSIIARLNHELEKDCSKSEAFSYLTITESGLWSSQGESVDKQIWMREDQGISYFEIDVVCSGKVKAILTSFYKDYQEEVAVSISYDNNTFDFFKRSIQIINNCIQNKRSRRPDRRTTEACSFLEETPKEIEDLIVNYINLIDLDPVDYCNANSNNYSNVSSGGDLNDNFPLLPYIPFLEEDFEYIINCLLEKVGCSIIEKEVENGGQRRLSDFTVYTEKDFHRDEEETPLIEIVDESNFKVAGSLPSKEATIEETLEATLLVKAKKEIDGNNSSRLSISMLSVALFCFLIL